jgi:hypothetical protein
VTITEFLATLNGEGGFTVLDVAAKGGEAQIGFRKSVGYFCWPKWSWQSWLNQGGTRPRPGIDQNRGGGGPVSTSTG